MTMAKQICSGTEELTSNIPADTFKAIMDDELCGGSGEEIDEEMIESVRLHCKEALQSAKQFLLDADTTL